MANWSLLAVLTDLADRGCDYDAQELKDYHAERMLSAASSMMSASKLIPWFLITMGCVHYISENCSVLVFVVSEFALLLCASLFHKGHARLLRLVQEQPMFWGLVVQEGLHTLSSLFVLLTSCAANDALLSHRIYITMTTQTNYYIAFSGHWACRSHLIFSRLADIVQWALFHHMMGYYTVAAAASGIVHIGLAILIHLIVDKRSWERFKTEIRLEEGRQSLHAMQTAFQAMLSSVFDASCTCDHRGHLITWTPQLQQLLAGGHLETLALDLCSYTSSSEEMVRMQNFMERVASSHGTDTQAHCAETIQITLQTSSSGQDAQTEMQLFGTALPQRPSQRETDGIATLFVGLKALKPGGAALPAHVGASNGDGDHKIPLERPQPSDLFNGERKSSFEPPKNLGQLDMPDDCASSLSFSLTDCMGSVSKLSSLPSKTRSQVSKRDSSTQTPSRRPPPLPGPRQNSPNYKQINSKVNVTTSRSRRLLQNFKETPIATTKNVIQGMLLHINPRGKGCCPLHIAVARFHAAVVEMTSWPCDAEFAPYNDWQCKDCLCMNTFYKEEGTDEPQCEICDGDD
eukprot:TRINITY_DN21212_c0_g1_i1.p1 TRINITY_DN21212_c0_g1~~TRINITY_DN21212_c0_g1_i1.p1  ORF type:complete len:574 (+),score=75.78 TRINITY_DN21212_c0_g1_i1:49-1770(+)